MKSNWQPGESPEFKLLTDEGVTLARSFTSSGLIVSLNRDHHVLFITLEPAAALELARDIEREFGGRP